MKNQMKKFAAACFAALAIIAAAGTTAFAATEPPHARTARAAAKRSAPGATEKVT